jgi:ABC-type polar amino acid transport system ATPase subunit
MAKMDKNVARPPNADVAAISVRAISKWFGVHQVLQEVSLDIGEGEVVVVCGPSGSGKSTLIRCINRLELVQAGEIVVFGESITGSRYDLVALRSRVGMVFQSFNLYPHKTALENVILAPMKVKGLDRREAERVAIALLTRVGVADKAISYPAYLSGGQQQRVAIARALAMEPKIILFDEPTSALDPEMIKEVLDVMSDLANDGMTMVVVTHEMGFARRVANRIAFLDEGKLVEVATPEQFFTAPSTDRAKQFLSKILDIR